MTKKTKYEGFVLPYDEKILFCSVQRRVIPAYVFWCSPTCFNVCIRSPQRSLFLTCPLRLVDFWEGKPFQ